jgi:hypothetical protein
MVSDWCNTKGGRVVATSNPLAAASLRWNDTLSSALVCSWNDLMPEAATGQIQIEYHVRLLGGVEFVKVWGATIRGHWDLICSCWTHPDSSNQSGLQFANGHKSEAFRATLDSIMQHQHLFRFETTPGTDCMIQISPPTEGERISALKMMDVLRDRLTN